MQRGITVTITRTTTTTDTLNNQVPGAWATVAIVDGCGVAPRTVTEDHDGGRREVTKGRTLYLPTGTDIGPHDRVKINNQLFEVVGEPAEWVSPLTGWAPGIVTQLKRVEG